MSDIQRDSRKGWLLNFVGSRVGLRGLRGNFKKSYNLDTLYLDSDALPLPSQRSDIVSVIGRPQFRFLRNGRKSVFSFGNKSPRRRWQIDVALFPHCAVSFSLPSSKLDSAFSPLSPGLEITNV